MVRVKVIVAGSRKWPWRQYLMDALDFYLQNYRPEEIQIVNGTAGGPDSWGGEWADAHGVEQLKMPADWDGLGRKAGMVRNRAMAEVATHLIAFWDGESPGTKAMIEIATDLGLVVRVLNLKRIRQAMGVNDV